MTFITRTKLTCPVCGYAEEVDIPSNYCVIRYVCTSCGVQLEPRDEECCVFCSYGEHDCIPSQQRRAVNGSR